MLSFDAATHRYYWEGKPVPGVTSVLAPLSSLHLVDPDLLDAASAFGTAVHLACELDDLGLLDENDLDPALAPYLAGWRRFSKDWQVKWDGIEEQVYHSRLKYAGTLDRRGTVTEPGRRVPLALPAIVDIKSSTQLYASVGPQLAAYASAVNDKKPDPHYFMRLAVQLKADGSYVAKVYTDPVDFALFSSLLTLHTWCSRHGITPRFLTTTPERHV